MLLCWGVLEVSSSMERVRPVLSWVSSENVGSMALPFIRDILQRYVFFSVC